MSDQSDKTSAVDEQKALKDKEAAPETKSEKEERKAAADFTASKKDDKLTMQVKVYSPFRDYYSGNALSVSAVNATGPFDILPRHHNFISLLSPCNLVVRTANDEKKIIISGGIMHVKTDQVVVFLDV